MNAAHAGAIATSDASADGCADGCAIHATQSSAVGAAQPLAVGRSLAASGIGRPPAPHFHRDGTEPRTAAAQRPIFYLATFAHGARFQLQHSGNTSTFTECKQTCHAARRAAPVHRRLARRRRAPPHHGERRRRVAQLPRARGHVAVGLRLREQLHQLNTGAPSDADVHARPRRLGRRLARPGLRGVARVRVRAAAHAAHRHRRRRFPPTSAPRRQRRQRADVRADVEPSRDEPRRPRQRARRRPSPTPAPSQVPTPAPSIVTEFTLTPPELAVTQDKPGIATVTCYIVNRATPP